MGVIERFGELLPSSGGFNIWRAPAIKWRV